MNKITIIKLFKSRLGVTLSFLVVVSIIISAVIFLRYIPVPTSTSKTSGNFQPTPLKNNTKDLIAALQDKQYDPEKIQSYLMDYTVLYRYFSLDKSRIKSAEDRQFINLFESLIKKSNSILSQANNPVILFASADDCEMNYDNPTCFTPYEFEFEELTHQVKVHEGLGFNTQLVNKNIIEPAKLTLEKFKFFNKGTNPIRFVLQNKNQLTNNPEQGHLMNASVVDDKCHINIFLTGQELSREEDGGRFRQSIAHELTHCIQFKHYESQLFDAYPTSLWWVEGHAEAFSDYVYPAVNYEWRFDNRYDIVSNILTVFDLNYENNLLFQYIANTKNHNYLFSLIQEAPNEIDINKHYQYLYNHPEFWDLQFQFAKEYLSIRLQDTSGGVRITTPQVVNVQIINRPQFISKDYKPFVIDRLEIQVPPSPYDTTIKRGVVRPKSNYQFYDYENDVWLDEIKVLSNQNQCGKDSSESSKFLLAMAAVNPSSDNLVYELQVEQDELYPDQQYFIDDSLIGTWELDETSFKSAQKELFIDVKSILDGYSQEIDYDVNIDSANGFTCLYDNNVIFSNFSVSQTITFSATLPTGQIVKGQIINQSQVSNNGFWSAKDGIFSTAFIESARKGSTRTIIPLFGIDSVKDFSDSELFDQKDPGVEYRIAGNNLIMPLPAFNQYKDFNVTYTRK